VFHVIITCPGHRFETCDVKGHETYIFQLPLAKEVAVLPQKRDMIYKGNALFFHPYVTQIACYRRRNKEM